MPLRSVMEMRVFVEPLVVQTSDGPCEAAKQVCCNAVSQECCGQVLDSGECCNNPMPVCCGNPDVVACGDCFRCTARAIHRAARGASQEDT